MLPSDSDHIYPRVVMDLIVAILFHVPLVI